MAYARFGKESEVYIFRSVHGGFSCCSCHLNENCMSEDLPDSTAALQHLYKHEEAGYKVPQGAINKIREEVKRGIR